MFDLKINVSHCDLYFMVQWFCLVSWRLFDVWTSNFRIMSQYDPTFDLKMNVDHCGLYVMVQWFRLITWRLFAAWTSYVGIMCQFDTTFDIIINVGHCDLGMVGRHNIFFCQNILYRNCIFQYIFPHFPANLTTFCSQFTIKCLGSGQKPA